MLGLQPGGQTHQPGGTRRDLGWGKERAEHWRLKEKQTTGRRAFKGIKAKTFLKMNERHMPQIQDFGDHTPFCIYQTGENQQDERIFPAAGGPSAPEWREVPLVGPYNAFPKKARQALLGGLPGVLTGSSGKRGPMSAEVASTQ